MFGQSNKDDMANSEDQPDNGGFVSTSHPDPTSAPEPPASTGAPVLPPSEDTALPPIQGHTPIDAPGATAAPEFGQPFNPGAALPAVEPATESSDDSAPTPPAPSDDLIEIKKEALQQLSPLVDHLDQDPEEKFKTTMMMIQAADNQSLIKEAYETAQKITDEKARAQALLDIVNEINYFTQQASS